jgi:hypothetical protein
MQELIVDGEKGVVHSELFKNELKARGIALKPRAPNQHARYIERRGALLRQALHVIEGQLKKVRISVTFPVLLAEAVFCGNCSTHVGVVTPYHAVYGRQPSIMPPLAIDTENLDEEGAPNDRVEAHVREVALQTMVEATAQARINRALRTQTALPGQASFELGDHVEYHRPSASKDTPGWRGPGVITELLFDQGQVVINHTKVVKFDVV